MKFAAIAAHPAVYQAAGSLPPGTGNLSLLVAWGTGLAGLACMLGFVGSMGVTGMKALGHGHFEGGMGAVVCLVCAVMLGAATTIFAVLGFSA